MRRPKSDMKPSQGLEWQCDSRPAPPEEQLYGPTESAEGLCLAG